MIIIIFKKWFFLKIAITNGQKIEHCTTKMLSMNNESWVLMIYTSHFQSSVDYIDSVKKISLLVSIFIISNHKMPKLITIWHEHILVLRFLLLQLKLRTWTKKNGGFELWQKNVVDDDYDGYDLDHGKSRGALCWRGKARVEP